MMDLMIRLLIISALCRSRSSGIVEHNRRSGRALSSNGKVASSIPHMVDVTECVLVTSEATALHY